MFDDLLQEESDDIAVVEPETLKRPRHANLCLGHKDIEQNLLKLYQDNKLPHALVFNGSRGIGKATFAYRLIRFLFQDQFSQNAGDSLFGGESLPAENFSVPQDGDAFQKIASGGLSDLHIIEREFDDAKGRYKGNIGVDSIRKITPFLFSTAAYGGWRIILIDDADTMNRNAQNALLKNLEEPPKNCLIILVCHQLGKMLPTIRSRVRVYNFKSLEDNNMREVLSLIPDEMTLQDKEFVSLISAGSPGLAKEFIEDGGLDVARKVLGCFETGENFRMKSFTLAGELSQRGADQSLQSFKIFMMWLSRHLTKLKALSLPNLQDLETLQVIESFYVAHDLQDMISLSDRLAQHFEQCNKSNLDKHHTVYKAMELWNL